MKPLTKILLTLSMSLLFIGCVMCGVAYVMGGMDLGKLDIDTTYETKTYTMSSADIENIELDVDKHEIVIKQSYAVDKITVDYAENEYDIFQYDENGTTFSLTNKQSENKFFRSFCLLFDKKNTEGRKLVITLPKLFSGNIVIKNEDANVELSDISLLEKLDISISNGDVVLTSVNCTAARVSVQTGELSIVSGAYEALDVTLVNQAKYVPIDDVEGTPAIPTEVPTVEPTLEPSAEPEAPTASPDESPEIEPTPDSTLEPVKTPTPTKTPTVLAVTAEFTLNGVDCKNLNITVYNTNITGSVARNVSYYNIETNNTESSNIETTENINALGSIVIMQDGGATKLTFK